LACGATAAIAAGTASAAAAKSEKKKSKKDKAATDASAAKESKSSLEAEFPKLVEEYLAYLKREFDLPEEALARVKRMIEYSCVGGKLNRALLVTDAVQTLAATKGLDYTQLRDKAVVLAWCIEIMQAYFLVADDIMDGSLTRRGQPCWYKQPDVKMDAINDSYLLSSFLYFLIREHFQDSKLRLDVSELFHKVSLQTEVGQMLDLLSQPQGRKDPELLKNFTMDNYLRIITHKTALYTFYLPIACGMYLTGYTEPGQFKIAHDIAVEMGRKFQIQDDWLDAFGDPEAIGKVGTDIQDHKCTWLVTMALKLMSQEQRRTLEAHYGKEDEKSIAAIKQLYVELGLKDDLFLKQEKASYKKIRKMIKEAEPVLPAGVFLPILDRIHLRQK